MKGTPHTRSGNIIEVDDGEHLKVHAGTTQQAEAIRVISEKLRARTTTKDLILFRKVTQYPTKIVAEYTVHRGQALAYSREMEKGSAMAEVGLKKFRSDAGRKEAMGGTLKKEFQFYLEHQDELVEKYNGKCVVIKNQTVLGAYSNEVEAIEKTSVDHELGTFLVQKCEPGSDSYTQTYHSRVAFG